MEEYIRNGHISTYKDCPICQQAQGPVVRHYQHPTRFDICGTVHVDLTGPIDNRCSWTQICADHGPQ
eukprot:557752-Prorocentrum_lima.AAC.1